MCHKRRSREGTDSRKMKPSVRNAGGYSLTRVTSSVQKYVNNKRIIGFPTKQKLYRRTFSSMRMWWEMSGARTIHKITYQGSLNKNAQMPVPVYKKNQTKGSKPRQTNGLGGKQ